MPEAKEHTLMRIVFTAAFLILSAGPLCAAQLLETPSYILSMDTYFRADVITYKNVFDLDSHNKNDSATYLGIDYSFGFLLAPKERLPKFYLKLERNGPGDYDAPIFTHHPVQNSGGIIDRYRGSELLPELEEFWMDTPLLKDMGFKIGLYTYEVGNGFSLNGSFENYGATLYRQVGNFNWRLYYCRPEVVYKNRRGPRVHQDFDQGYFYHHNASNFFSTDLKVGDEERYVQPYIGALVDYTSPDKRDNTFSAPIKKDLLGTYGIAANFANEDFFMRLELARNFGKGESQDPSFKNIEHEGYFAFGELGTQIKKFAPSLQFTVASGNKVPLDQAANSTLTSGRDMAFSSFSAFNRNLGGSISACNGEARPLILTGSGCSLHSGLPRPGTLFSSDYDNLIMPAFGFNHELTDRFAWGLRYYYALSFARPVGSLGGEARFLSRELGHEVDANFDYRLNDHVVLTLWTGYFLPGKFYREERDDTEGSLFSPFVRGDRNANSAYQIEFSIEFQY